MDEPGVSTQWRNGVNEVAPIRGLILKVHSLQQGLHAL
jgi:hypothetical protein